MTSTGGRDGRPQPMTALGATTWELRHGADNVIGVYRTEGSGSE